MNNKTVRAQHLLCFALASILLSVAIILFCAGNAFADESYTYKPAVRIKTQISSRNINRIEFGHFGISEVVGDDSKYQILSDHGAKNVFITSKVPVGQEFTITLIGSGGEIQDIDLIVRDTSSQSIVINVPVVRVKDDSTEIAKMLRAMVNNEAGKYYVTEVNADIAKNLELDLKRNLSFKHDKINIVHQKTYRFGDIKGVVLSIKNASDNTISLSDEDFSRIFADVIATSIENKVLFPKQDTRVFLITKVRVHS